MAYGEGNGEANNSDFGPQLMLLASTLGGMALITYCCRLCWKRLRAPPPQNPPINLAVQGPYAALLGRDDLENQNTHSSTTHTQPGL